MDAERWSRIQEIFETARDLDGEARERYLAGACAGDPGLGAEVRSLLHASTDADEFLGEVARRAGLVLNRSDAEEPEAAGLRFGAYRVVRLLARGGMGAVYVAERADDQFRMEVALKAVPGTIHTPEARARFLSERQILAHLHHPNIAQLLDGGVSGDGVPYFVMELVDGRPIDLFCREEGLGTEDRIRLFLQVCEGIRHAHTSLVVHRDLKPANILVTPDGIVKLLDFGIARMLESDEDLYQTAMNAPHPMTLAFASPEQLRGAPPATTCDIYGLGVLLYRLLTDRHPYDFETGSSFPRVQEIVCEVTPRPPSQAQEPGAPDFGRLPKDLDAVTLKALAKEPERRYSSVPELIRDVERFLEGRPVRARPPTFGYRLRRFAGRNRAAVAFASMVALLALSLLGLGVRYTIDTRAQAAALAQEVQTTRAVSDFLVGLFTGADPTDGGSDTISAGTLLARGVERSGSDLEVTPLVRARILRTLADVYSGLGMGLVADSLAFQAFLIRRDELGMDHPETLNDALYLAGLNREMQNDRSLGRAESLFREILDVARGDPALRRHEAVAEAGLGQTLLYRRQPEEALPLLRSGIAHAQEVMDAGDLAFLRMRQTLARAFRDLEMPDSALAIFQELLPLYEALGPEAANDTGSLRVGMAILLRRQGRLAEAETQYRTVLDRHGPTMARTNVRTVHLNLATVLQEQGKMDEVLAVLEALVGYAQEHWPPEHWQVGASHAALAQALVSAGRLEEAETRTRRALEIYEAGLEPGHRWTARQRGFLGDILLRLGRLDEAEPELLQALTELRTAAGPDAQETRVVEGVLQELRRRRAGS